MKFVTPFKKLETIEYKYLYLIKLYNENEIFYKIGITIHENVNERFKSIPYNCEIIKIYKSYSSFIHSLEVKLLSLVDKYEPLINFGGQTETTLDLTMALEYIESLNWLKDLEECSLDSLRISNWLAIRRTMTAYEAIEYGIEPSLKNAVEYYDDPVTDNELLFKAFPLFNEWINSGITTAIMRSCNLKRETISERAIQSRTLMCNSDEVKGQMSLKVGEVYTREELLKKVLEIYESLNIKVDKPKATDIKKWYEIKSHAKRVNGELKTAYKIIKEL